MSRPSSMMAARNLTLTEELEKLEQSITLTLQEIDHNFSRAHRIVTGSILPIVEQYAKHSEAVWEGSKFWKQFFEASANVSLSGYEEPANNDDTTLHQDETTHASTTYDEEGEESPTVRSSDDHTIRSGADHPSRFDDSDDERGIHEDSILSSPSVAHAHSTPRATVPALAFADFGSPYEALKRELHGGDSDDEDNDATAGGIEGDSSGEGDHGLSPTTPGRAAAALPDMSMTPESSPFAPGSAAGHTTTRGYGGGSTADPVLHRMLDKTYRIGATPHRGRKTTGATPGTANRRAGAGAARARPALNFDSSPLSSPGGEAPQLRADIFSSPLKTPRTPGVSVLRTPGAQQQQQQQRSALRPGTSTSRQLDFGTATRTLGGREDLVTWDSDSDNEGADGAFSPPKTMQFHVPQSRLLQTPAREASRRIVEDLLLTAGGGDFTDTTDVTALREGEGEGYSPSLVRGRSGADDSF